MLSLRRPVVALFLSAAFVAPASADLVFFTSRAAFNAAAPGLPIEGFENAGCTTTEFTGPLSSTSSNSCFMPGDILPGITFVDSPGPDSGGLFVASPGQSSQATIAIGQDSPSSDSLDVILEPDVTAVAFDIYQNFGGGSQSGSPQPYPVSVFGPGGVLLGSIVVIVESDGPGGFFGVIAINGQIIDVVSVNNPSAFDVIDDVAFGIAQAPEPGALGLLALSLALLGLRRR